VGKVTPALPLFPDLLEQNDPFGRAADYRRSGHGVWTFLDGVTYRRRSPECSEARHLVVIYRDERRWRFKEDWTGKCWIVELRHYVNTWIQPPRGKSYMQQQTRATVRSFATRDEAIQLCEKLLAVFARINRREEEPAAVELIEDQDAYELDEVAGG